MIRLQPISTSDLQHYKFMEELLVDSFPPEEYRQLEQLREFTDRTGNFHNNIIFDDDLPIGFITYWDFGNFYYVEHFATNPALRNGGYGKRTLAECFWDIHDYSSALDCLNHALNDNKAIEQAFKSKSPHA